MSEEFLRRLVAHMKAGTKELEAAAFMAASKKDEQMAIISSTAALVIASLCQALSRSISEEVADE